MESCVPLTFWSFSTGSLSPVRDDWLMNKSFASIMRTSAGIISPADRWTISPATASSSGISFFACPSRSTVQVVVIMANSFSAALPLRDSCTKRSVPEIITIVRMITTVRQSKSSGALPNRLIIGSSISVIKDTSARQNRMPVKGLTKASVRRLATDFLFSCVTLLGPYFARLETTPASSRPFKPEFKFFSVALIG